MSFSLWFSRKSGLMSIRKERRRRWHHSSCKTSQGALVALQQSHILPVSKSMYSVPCAYPVVNVQPARRRCSIFAPQLFSPRAPGCSTQATYSHALILLFFNFQGAPLSVAGLLPGLSLFFRLLCLPEDVLHGFPHPLRGQPHGVPEALRFVVELVERVFFPPIQI